MSQVDDAPTQELSPSHFDSYIHKSRSARQLEGDTDLDYDYDNDRQGHETQFTLHEGDEGHIDLVSSFEQRLEGPQELDSEPAADDFSPTQPERALSQFPESQRFKTPATAGKKRRYNGDVIETPYLPRNPLRQETAQSNGNIMGLSQAFAATQANTSPFVHNGLVDLQSDRPSPNIDLQPRPVTAVTSSPLRMLPEFTRASTEPASRYISVKQSQAEREKQAELQRQQELAEYDDDSDDGLVDEHTQSIRTRRRGGIEQRVRTTLRQLSSPSKRANQGPSATKSSPIRPSAQRSPNQSLPTNRVGYTIMSSPPSDDDDAEVDNETEVETEQEDNIDIAVTRSSQGVVALDAEDKENFSETGTQVPETTARLHQILNGFSTHVQNSPSLRRSNRYTITSRIGLDSSEPIAVANSQPSQPQRQRRTFSTSPKRAASEGIDFVPQSPTASPQRTLESRPLMSVDHTERVDDALAPVNPGPTLVDQLPTIAEPFSEDINNEISCNPHGTIPETSSNEQDIQNNSSHIKERQNPSEGSTHNQFETAESHLPPSTNDKQPSNEVDLSSPPIDTTAPGQKRKRLTEIAAEPSPQKSQSQFSFNANEALQLDMDLEVGSEISTGHLLPDNPSLKRRGVVISSSGESQKENVVSYSRVDEPSQTPPSRKFAGSATTELDGPESIKELTQQRTGYSRRDRKPSSKSLSALRENLGIKPRTSRSSVWDIIASPPQKAGLVTGTLTSLPAIIEHPQASSKSKQKGRRTANRTKKDMVSEPPATTSIEVEQPSQSPGSAALSDVGQREPVTPAITDQILAPNMVFACFNGKTRAYYPALCRGLSGGESKRFSIQWEGYDPDEIDEHGVRSLDLRVGDLVKVDLKGFPKVSYVVRGFQGRIGPETPKSDIPFITDIRGYKTALVAPKQRKSLPAEMSTESVEEVPLSAVYLDSNMWGQMKDRLFEFKLPSQDSYLPHFSTPAERTTNPSTPTSRHRRTQATGTALVAPSGLFANMTFAVSYDDESRKGSLVDLVKRNGGHIVKDSFQELLEPENLHLKAHFASYTFAALLTESHSTKKAKYLQALALGIPCLSGKWIDACVEAGERVDWTHYLLPAGECFELDGAIKSRVLPYMSNSAEITVREMIDSRPNLLTGARVIVVGTEDKRKGYRFLIQALGAESVEGASNLNAARRLLLSNKEGDHGKNLVGYIVVNDKADGPENTTSLNKATKSKKGSKSLPVPDQSKEEHVKIISRMEIKQSLILGKLWTQ